MQEVLGCFTGKESHFYVKIEDGEPMIKVLDRDDNEKAILKFDDICVLEGFIHQLEFIKRSVFMKNLDMAQEKKFFGRLNVI